MTKLKFKKDFSGEYVSEFIYNGQQCRVEISNTYPGWSWSAYVNGQHVGGDGGNGFRLKDFKHNDASYFID